MSECFHLNAALKDAETQSDIERILTYLMCVCVYVSVYVCVRVCVCVCEEARDNVYVSLTREKESEKKFIMKRREN